MQVYDLGERVRVTIPRATDPDHHYDGDVGQVVGACRSGLTAATGDPRDAYLYRVDFSAGADDAMLFHHSDLTALPG